MRRLLFIVVGVAIVAGGAYFVLSSPSKPAEVAAPKVPVARAAPPPERTAAAPPAPEPAAPTTVTPRRRTTPVAPAEPAAPAAAAAPTVATLRIESDVPGAQVFVDRQFVGAAPVTAPDLQPGSHVINVTAPGFDGVSTRIDVEPGSRDVMVKLREVRLNVSAQVVHKHRMGSCTGKLVATPQGLRYETTDKEDAFSAPLANLETFEVDYLAKNLRIKPAKGKRYDFTDPEGNADKLFVFHRDVEKARERLKKGDSPAE